MPLPFNRAFAGKRYKLVTRGLVKREANQTARGYKSDGHLARVVKDRETGLWHVYVKIRNPRRRS